MYLSKEKWNQVNLELETMKKSFKVLDRVFGLVESETDRMFSVHESPPPGKPAASPPPPLQFGCNSPDGSAVIPFRKANKNNLDEPEKS